MAPFRPAAPTPAIETGFVFAMTLVLNPSVPPETTVTAFAATPSAAALPATSVPPFDGDIARLRVYPRKGLHAGEARRRRDRRSRSTGNDSGECRRGCAVQANRPCVQIERSGSRLTGRGRARGGENRLATGEVVGTGDGVGSVDRKHSRTRLGQATRRGRRDIRIDDQVGRGPDASQSASRGAELKNRC